MGTLMMPDIIKTVGNTKIFINTKRVKIIKNQEIVKCSHNKMVSCIQNCCNLMKVTTVKSE